MALTNETVKGLRIEFNYSSGDSRENDNLTKIIGLHSRYSVGDKHDYDHKDHNGWEEMKKAIMRKENVSIIEPLYMLDHSGLVLSTSPFSNHWDSGQLGFIIITKEKMRECYGVKRITKKLKERAMTVLQGELETYNQDLCGDVYGYTCYKDGVEVDSCGGFYGSNPNENGMFDTIPEEFEILLKDIDQLHVD